MFARLSLYENVDLEVADQLTRWVEATETDPFRELPGYSGSIPKSAAFLSEILRQNGYATASIERVPAASASRS